MGLKNRFTLGEIDQWNWGQYDSEEYQLGVAWLENFMVLPQGGLNRRRGYERLLQFEVSDNTLRLVHIVAEDEDYILFLSRTKYGVYRCKGGTISIENASGLNPYPLSDNGINSLRYCTRKNVVVFVCGECAPFCMIVSGGFVTHTPLKVSREVNLVETKPDNFAHTNNVINYDEDVDIIDNAGNFTAYPRVINYIANRIWLANTEQNPNKVWVSKRTEDITDINISTYNIYATVIEQYQAFSGRNKIREALIDKLDGNGYIMCDKVGLDVSGTDSAGVQRVYYGKDNCRILPTTYFAKGGKITVLGGDLVVGGARVVLTARTAGIVANEPSIIVTGGISTEGWAFIETSTKGVDGVKAVYKISVDVALTAKESITIENVAREAVFYAYSASETTREAQATAIANALSNAGGALYDAQINGTIVTLTAKEVFTVRNVPRLTKLGSGGIVVIQRNKQGIDDIKAVYTVSLDAALVETETLTIKNVAIKNVVNAVDESIVYEDIVYEDIVYEYNSEVVEIEEQVAAIADAINSAGGVQYEAQASGDTITLTAGEGGAIKNAPVFVKSNSQGLEIETVTPGLYGEKATYMIIFSSALVDDETITITNVKDTSFTYTYSANASDANTQAAIVTQTINGSKDSLYNAEVDGINIKITAKESGAKTDPVVTKSANPPGVISIVKDITGVTAIKAVYTIEIISALAEGEAFSISNAASTPIIYSYSASESDAASQAGAVAEAMKAVSDLLYEIEAFTTTVSVPIDEEYTEEEINKTEAEYTRKMRLFEARLIYPGAFCFVSFNAYGAEGLYWAVGGSSGFLAGTVVGEISSGDFSIQSLFPWISWGEPFGANLLSMETSALIGSGVIVLARSLHELSLSANVIAASLSAAVLIPLAMATAKTLLEDNLNLTLTLTKEGEKTYTLSDVGITGDNRNPEYLNNILVYIKTKNSLYSDMQSFVGVYHTVKVEEYSNADCGFVFELDGGTGEFIHDIEQSQQILILTAKSERMADYTINGETQLVRKISAEGCENIKAVFTGGALYTMRRGNRSLQKLQWQPAMNAPLMQQTNYRNNEIINGFETKILCASETYPKKIRLVSKDGRVIGVQLNGTEAFYRETSYGEILDMQSFKVDQDEHVYVARKIGGSIFLDRLVDGIGSKEHIYLDSYSAVDLPVGEYNSDAVTYTASNGKSYSGYAYMSKMRTLPALGKGVLEPKRIPRIKLRLIDSGLPWIRGYPEGEQNKITDSQKRRSGVYDIPVPGTNHRDAAYEIYSDAPDSLSILAIYEEEV